MRKIAIIGGGAAGVAALYALYKTHDVLLFEANNYLGGHAYSHPLEIDNQCVSIDMGVEYFHERLSPNFCELLRLFNVETFIAPLSFRATSQSSPYEYWSNLDVGGTLRQQLNEEMNRFHLDMLSLTKINDATYNHISIGAFLTEKKYSKAFQEQALLPLLTTFSGCKAPSLDYSLMYIALSFNMNLLSFFSPSHWRKIKGGMRAYYGALYQLLKNNIHLDTPIESVEYKKNGVEIRTKTNQLMVVDEVIFACQAELAYKIIKNKTQIQESILGSFESVDIESILHHDEKAIQNSLKAKEYCQFALQDETHADFAGFLTRVNHHLYPYQSISKPIYVSFDMQDAINPELIIATKQWKLPKLRPIDLKRKGAVHQIQGQNQMWFCGTDYSLTGHESAIISGFVIAQRLGAPYLFSHHWHAKTQFNVMKQFMNVYSKHEKIGRKWDLILYNTAKKMNLHKKFASYFANDILF